MRYFITFGIFGLFSFVFACIPSTVKVKQQPGNVEDSSRLASLGLLPVKDSFFAILCTAAVQRTFIPETYDGSYRKIAYPGGDVPDSLGVCTDLIIRAYRKLGLDLQKLVHEDIQRAKSVYDKRRKIDRIDANIDHRRTHHLQTFFTRRGAQKVVSQNAIDYLPGDIVFWDIAYGHVGIVINKKSQDGKRWLMAHNIGRGSEIEDCLLNATIIDHYRWDGK